MKTINGGDILWAEFPFNEVNDKKARPALVLDLDDAGRVQVAYGSTKQVCDSPLPHEFVVTKDSCGQGALDEMGLKKNTRFDLRKTCWLVIDLDVKDHIGKTPNRLLYRLMKAVKAAG